MSITIGSEYDWNGNLHDSFLPITTQGESNTVRLTLPGI